MIKASSSNGCYFVNTATSHC